MIENGIYKHWENVDEDLHVRHEFVELRHLVKESEEVVKEWEDCLGLEKDQEFCSKEVVWDLVHRAAIKNLFGVNDVKSDPVRLMIQFSQAAMVCDW